MKNFSNKIFSLAIIFIALISFSCCDKILLEKKIKHGELSNGLNYFVYQNKTPKESASLRLIVKVGSVDEDDDQQGVAHFLEHLAFNGTKKYPNNSLVKTLETFGVRYGSDLNAYTTFDHTVYELDMPLTKSENLDVAFEVLQEWAFSLLLEDNEVEKERQIILQEERDRKSANSKMRDSYWPILMKSSAYENRKPIGEMDIIANVAPSRIRDFYSKFYQPYRMTVAVVGDINCNQTIKKIKSYFGDFKNSDSQEAIKNFAKTQKEFLTIDDFENQEVLTFSDGELTSYGVWFFNRIENNYLKGTKQLKAELINIVATSILSKRLEELAKSSEAVSVGVVSAFCTPLNWARYKDFHLVGFNFDGDKTESALNFCYQFLADNRVAPITKNQIEEQAAVLLQSLKNQADGFSKQNSKAIVQEIYSSFLSDEFVANKNWLYKKSKSLLKKITPADVEREIFNCTKKSNQVALLFGAQKKSSLFDKNKFQTLLDEIDKNAEEKNSSNSSLTQTLQTEKSEEQISNSKKLLELELSQSFSNGSILKKEEIEYLSAYKYFLSNGITVYFRPSKFSNNKINLSAHSYGGTSLCETQNFASAELADDLFYNCDIANFDSVKRDLWLKQNGINFSLSIDEMTETLNANCENSKLENLLKYISAIFTELNPSEEDFELTKTRYLNYAQNRDNNPNSWFTIALNELLRNRGDRNPELSLANAKKANYNETKKFLLERFADPRDFIFIFTGNISTKKFEKIVEKNLALIPTPKDEFKKEEFKAVFNKYPQKNSSTAFKKNSDPQTLIYKVFHKELAFEQKKSHDFAATASILTRVLDNQIREQESGTYSIGSFASIRREPYEELLGAVVFSCDPKRFLDLRTKTDKVISDFASGNFDEVLIKNYKISSLIELKEAKEKDNFWQSQILLYALGKSNEEIFNNAEKLINDFSKQDCINAANELFYTTFYTEAILQPK